MKSRSSNQNAPGRWHWVFVLGFCAAASTLFAADTNLPPAAAAAPEPLTPEQMFEGGTNAYNNWIDFSVGGFMTSGNKSQSQQRFQNSRSAFGGIEDFHYQANLDKITILSIDGRALFDNDDYKLSLNVEREKIGYVRFSYSEFRTWYNGDGGYYPPSDNYYSLTEDPLALDRGQITFEGGLTLAKAPKINFKYTHNFRNGEKSSTIWGITHPAVGVSQS